MIGLIVTGHGNFASGLTSSLKLIAGEPKNYVAVDFLESYSVDDLERELTKALDELKDCEGVMVGYPRGNVEVVAGTNLPMLIEVNMGRQFVEELGMLTEMAMNTGKDQVVRYEFKPVQQEEPTDGI